MNDSRSDRQKKKRDRKVQRHSPDRLLRRPVELPGGVKVSAERHKGRIVVRVESPGHGGRLPESWVFPEWRLARLNWLLLGPMISRIALIKSSPQQRCTAW
jgi:hypothetical protein